MTDKTIAYADQLIAEAQKDPMNLANFINSILVGNADNDHVYRTTIGDFFLDHWTELAPATELFPLPQEYFYQPKTLSWDLYGTTDLWLALLRVNGMRNVTEFHNPIIRIYNPARLRELIDIFFKREGKTT